MKVKATERKEIEIEIPEGFLQTYVEGFITLFSTGLNCDACLLVYMLKEYKSQPTIINDGFFREQFRSFCDKQGAKPFADSTIKRSLKALTELKLVEQPEYGQYKLHSRFFVWEK